MGHLGGNLASGEDISHDGSVIAGYSQIDLALGGYYHAFRWVEGATGGIASNPEMYDLGTLGGTSSWATAVSGNGAVVVAGPWMPTRLGQDRVRSELGALIAHNHAWFTATSDQAGQFTSNALEPDMVIRHRSICRQALRRVAAMHLSATVPCALRHSQKPPSLKPAL